MTGDVMSDSIPPQVKRYGGLGGGGLILFALGYGGVDMRNRLIDVTSSVDRSTEATRRNAGAIRALTDEVRALSNDMSEMRANDRNASRRLDELREDVKEIGANRPRGGYYPRPTGRDK